jgi:hypothetical protein
VKEGEPIMLRDFSDSCKQELLNYIKGIENGEVCNFTDWYKDHWCDYADLIGELGLAGYINNVNSYHKKVTAKNKAAVSSVEKIFNEVHAVDHSYCSTFTNIRDSLEKIETYISKMAEIISPEKGSFTAENVKSILSQAYYDDLLNDFLRKYLKIENGEIVPNYYELLANFLRVEMMPPAELIAYSLVIANFGPELLDHSENLLHNLNNAMDKVPDTLDIVYKLYLCIKHCRIFKIVKVGNYYHIKGGISGFLKNCDMEDLEGIEGTRYKIGSKAFIKAGLNRFVPPDASFSEGAKKFLENITDKSLWEKNFKDYNSFKNGLKKIYGFEKGTKISTKINNVGKILGYASIAFDTGMEIKNDVESGATVSHTIGDATATAVKGLGSMAIATGCAEVGAAIGTAIPIPGVGTVVGAAVGFGIGLAASKLYDWAVDDAKINGKTVKEWVSTGVEKACDAVGDAAKGAAKAVQDAGNAIKKKLDSSVNLFNGFFGDVGKAVMAW